MVQYEMSVDGESSAETDEFFEREWDRWHIDQGHDPSENWSRLSVQVVARGADGSILGAANGRVSAGVGHLSELIIARTHRGTGIGSELLRRFEQHCVDAGCHKLAVHTDYDGAAHHFYRRHQWQDEAVFRRDRGGRDFVRLYKYTDDLSED